VNQIQRSLISTGVFVAVAGGVAALAVWDKKSRLAEDDRKEQDKKAFSDIKNEDVETLEIVHQGARVSLRKEGVDWRITEPMATAGDDGAIASVISAVTGLEIKKRLEPGKVQPAQVGLDKPETVVTLKTKDGKAAQLYVGKKSSFDESRYVRAGPDAATAEISIVSDHAVNGVQKVVADLREKRLVSLTSNEVDALEVTVHKPSDNAVSFKAMRSGESGKHGYDDGWKVTAPSVTNADREEMMRIVNAVSGLRATEFVDDEGKQLAKWGLDAPSVTIKLAAPNKEQAVTVSVVKNGTANKYYAKRADRPNVAEIPENVYTAALKDLFGLRDKRVLDFDRERVMRIAAVLPGGGQLTLEKQTTDGDAEWKVVEPAKANAMSWKVSSLIYTLANFKVTRFAKEGLESPPPDKVLTEFGLEKASSVITLEDAEGKQMAKLLVGKQQGEELFVMAEGASFVGVVEARRLEDLPKKAEAFVDHSPEDGDGAEPDEG
jgi:hypothetical protein